MEVNWKIIVPIVMIAIAIVIFLIRKNLQDKKQVEQYFINEAEGVETEETEPNNEI